MHVRFHAKGPGVMAQSTAQISLPPEFVGKPPQTDHHA